MHYISSSARRITYFAHTSLQWAHPPYGLMGEEHVKEHVSVIIPLRKHDFSLWLSYVLCAHQRDVEEGAKGNRAESPRF